MAPVYVSTERAERIATRARWWAEGATADHVWVVEVSQDPSAGAVFVDVRMRAEHECGALLFTDGQLVLIARDPEDSVVELVELDEVSSTIGAWLRRHTVETLAWWASLDYVTDQMRDARTALERNLAGAR